MMRTAVGLFALCLLPVLYGQQADASQNAWRAAPSFGGVVSKPIEAEGVGSSVEDATLRALDSAISQVNGRRVQSVSGSSQAGISLDVNGMRRLDASSRAYADLIVSSSGGAIRSFELLSIEEVARVEEEDSLYYLAKGDTAWVQGLDISLSAESKLYSHYWRVRIRAEVARYESPPDDGKPRLAIASTRVASNSYPMGNDRVAASDVGNELRRRLNDIIAQTNRFLLLDRALAPELQEEIDFINSGRARLEDVARVGQKLAADLLLIPTIERFEYKRFARDVRMSERELVSYVGGGSISIKLVNAATGELVISRTFSEELPSLEPSTLPRAVDGRALAGTLADRLAAQALQAILIQIFPVSVVAMQGDQLVLSQGGEAVRPGSLYEVIRLGDVITDPQTGRSLGRIEIPAGKARIERVSGQLAYATLLDTQLPTDVSFTPGMLELRGQLAVPHDTIPPKTRKAAAIARPSPASKAPPPEKDKPDDDEDW